MSYLKDILQKAEERFKKYSEKQLEDLAGVVDGDGGLGCDPVDEPLVAGIEVPGVAVTDDHAADHVP